jgi:uncharacterized SAM-binding protein YcdF (DUF218 family)
MHKMVSYLMGFILSPFYWILILLAISFIVKKTGSKKILRFIAAIVFILFSSPLIMTWFTAKWQWPRGEIKPGKSYSCGIVLGGFASIDAENYPYFNGAADRFIQVLKLYKLGQVQNILVCGGNSRSTGKKFGEAQFVKEELETMGVPAERIFIEDNSNNTADNARFAKHLMDSLKMPSPYLLITSASHMPRARLLFSKAGLAVEPFACNYSSANAPFSLSQLVPRYYILNDWESMLKEVAGYLWYK